MKFRPGFLLGALLGLSFAVYAATLSWTPPTQRQDGTPLSLSELAEYRLYCGKPGEPREYIEAIAAPETSLFADNLLPNGSWSCVLTAVDTEGRESAASNVLDFTVGEEPPPVETAPPMPPVFNLVDG